MIVWVDNSSLDIARMHETDWYDVSFNAQMCRDDKEPVNLLDALRAVRTYVNDRIDELERNAQ